MGWASSEIEYRVGYETAPGDGSKNCVIDGHASAADLKQISMGVVEGLISMPKTLMIEPEGYVSQRALVARSTPLM